MILVFFFCFGLFCGFVLVMAMTKEATKEAHKPVGEGYAAPNAGYRGTDAPVHVVPTTSEPRSAVPPPPVKTIRIILHEGPCEHE